MAISLDVILTTLQNGVYAIRDLTTTIGNVFPQSTASSSTASAGSLTFSSSQPDGFMIVQTSSGATVKIPYYPE